MKINYVRKVLKNGVTLFMYIDPNMRKTYVEYSINYGSNGRWFNFYYKGKKYHVLPGCAHFLEHMLGEHSKYGNIYKYFTSIKYDNNAETSINYTRYYFVGVNDIKESIERLINIVDDPVFTEEDVEETKHAIIEETKRGLNNVERVGYAIYKRNLFKDVDIFDETLCTIGNEETTKNLDYKTLKLCYDAFYYDANKTILIAGNFDEQEMINYIESIYSKLKNHKKEIKEYKYKNLGDVKKEKEIYYMPTNDDYVTIGFKEKIRDYSKKEITFFLDFVNTYKFSDSKDFEQKLKKRNIVSYFTKKGSSFYDSDYFDIVISAKVKDTEKFIEEIKKYIKKTDLTEEEFNLYKKSVIAEHATLKDYKYRVFNTFIYRKEYSENFDELEFLKSLSYEKFRDFFNSLSFNNCTVSIIRSVDKKML